MDSVPFLTSLIAVVWLVLWFYRSDKRPANEPMDGIFALRQTARAIPERTKIGAKPAPTARTIAPANEPGNHRRDAATGGPSGGRPQR